jgi:hypothetical protein
MREQKPLMITPLDLSIAKAQVALAYPRGQVLIVYREKAPQGVARQKLEATSQERHAKTG